MGHVAAIGLIFITSLAFANKPVCFEDKKELTIPTTKYTLTNRGEVLNAGNKFANLPLPKGFVGDCVVAATFKNDPIVILSMTAKDYDEKNAFVFRLSTKETKLLWSLAVKRPVEPRLPFVNDKVIVVPTIGEVFAMNPETGTVRWKYGPKETENVDFKKLNLNGTTLQVEGSKPFEGDNNSVKFELSIYDGKLIPPKKIAP